MDIKSLKTLHSLAEAKYLVRQQMFKGLLQKETAIRQEIQRLEQQARLSERQNSEGMRTIGADLIWKAWLGKAKTKLNMQLALILAEKEQHIRQVRQAYGKVLASQELITVLVDDRQKKTRDASLEQAIATSLFGIDRK